MKHQLNEYDESSALLFRREIKALFASESRLISDQLVRFHKVGNEMTRRNGNIRFP
jgi:hypothetical protein